MIFFDRQFQRVPSGYGYRENGRGPMLPCTEEEYASFRSIASRRFILAFFLFFFSVIGMAFLFGEFMPRDLSNTAEILLTFPMMIIPFAVLYFSVRRSMVFPSKLLAGRTPLAPAVAKGKAG